MRAYRVRDGQFYVHGGLEIYGQLLFFRRATHCMIEVGCDDERGWGVTLGFPWLFYLHLSIGKPLPRLRESREMSLRAFSGAIWWSVWRDPMGEWNRNVPRWRDGNFNAVDFLLGRAVCTRRDVEVRDILVPMPERAYKASAKLVEFTWKRPRWPARKMLRVQIDVPEGIPHEGKGENSWDCGTDATFGITTGPCRSIAEGVGALVGSVLHDRVRYGGYRDWTWERDSAGVVGGGRP